MANAPKEAPKLTFVEIVMNADAEVIKAAYEARVEVDKLLAQRQEAYRRIAELEAGVDQIVGEAGLFVFPPPPLPVAAPDTASARARRPGKAATAAAKAPPTPPAPAAPAADTATPAVPAAPDEAHGKADDSGAARGGPAANRTHGPA